MPVRLPLIDAESPGFPAPDQALVQPDGLLAVGGQLTPELLLAAYRKGIFPWYEEPQPVLWWCPSQRAVLVPGREHVSRTMARVIRQGGFSISSNTAFAQVIEACAAPRAKAQGTWITDTMIRAYRELHHLGCAHSVECWRDGQLIGGLYGVQVGAVFCGESMFSLVANASKLAFISLSRTLAHSGFSLIDCQLENPHLTSLGVTMVSRQSFLETLARDGKQGINWPQSQAFLEHLASAVKSGGSPR